MCQPATNIRIFKGYKGTKKALKQQAVNAMYLRTLAHCITGFANVTTKQMLTHLYTSYGFLSLADLQANNIRVPVQYGLFALILWYLAKTFY